MKRFMSLGVVLILSGLAAAQTDLDQGSTAPNEILRELAAKAAAMPAVSGAQAPAVVPALPLGTKKEYEKPFQDAFLNAVKRLRSPKLPKCAAFYGEGGEAKFESAEYRFLPLGKPRVNGEGLVTVVGAATHAEGAPPASVFINSEGPFLRQSMYVIGKPGFQTVDMGTNRRGADFGALLLLHELGHIVGRFGPDADDSKLNRSYTEQVLKNCFAKDP